MDNYCVETSTNLEDLIKAVNQQKALGFICVGGINNTMIDGFCEYLQAMEKAPHVNTSNMGPR